MRSTITHAGPLAVCHFFILMLFPNPFCDTIYAETIAARSIYSDLSGADCKPLDQNIETGASVRECQGPGGFRLLVLHDDDRSSVTIVTPEDKRFPLDFWNVVTHGFSDVGAKAEWRIKSQSGSVSPIGLVVRVNYLDQTNLARPKNKSVLAVAKITTNQACVVQIVTSTASANVHARKLADDSASQRCLPRLP
jgi:hypothetical protein